MFYLVDAKKGGTADHKLFPSFANDAKVGKSFFSFRIGIYIVSARRSFGAVDTIKSIDKVN
jgi:hypothetical protein